MAVLMTINIPVPRDVLEAVTEEMGARQDPPEGLIAHLVTDSGEGCQVVDIWESEQQIHTFTENRLMPAMGKVLADRGIDLPVERMPQPTVTPAHDLVMGR